jgi:hypothetical protein
MESMESKIRSIASKMQNNASLIAAENNKHGRKTSKGKEKIPDGYEQIMASMEIDKEIFLDEIFGLRFQYWDIQEKVHMSYDFGLISVDCTPFRNKITRHLKGLIQHLENYQKKDFIAKMEKI